VGIRVGTLGGWPDGSPAGRRRRPRLQEEVRSGCGVRCVGGAFQGQRFGDLGVRETWGVSSRTSRSHVVSSARRGSGSRLRIGCAATRSIKRRVTGGERSASPSATVWMAAISCSGELRFEEEAAGAGAEGAEDVLVDLEGGQDDHLRVGVALSSSAVAAMPSRSGMRTSMVVVDEHHAHTLGHRCARVHGSCACSSKRDPLRPAWREPPSSFARSRIPAIPRPPPGRAAT
jgi:hypothetical protein